jgi:plastocyanin
MKVWLTALLAGIGAAVLVTGIPALAASRNVAVNGFSWNPSQVTIAPGEDVSWSNGSAIAHNVCVARAGETLVPTVATDPAPCTEFRNGDPSASWAGSTADEHIFPAAGTYQFICQAHPTTMKGTVVVGSSGTTTTTTTGTTTTGTTTTGTGTTTTETTPTSTQTGTTPTQTTKPADTTDPRFTAAIKRRAGRKTLTLAFGSSEAGRLEATVFRRPPRARSFARIGKASLKVRAGANTLTVPRNAGGALRRGAYRVRLALVDVAGNRSTTRLLTFKIA